jgi:hypothetical protein
MKRLRYHRVPDVRELVARRIPLRIIRRNSTNASREIISRGGKYGGSNVRVFYVNELTENSRERRRPRRQLTN